MRCLPLLKPFHITDARRIKRFFTGDLKAEGIVCRSLPYSKDPLRSHNQYTLKLFVLLEEEEQSGGLIKSESYEATTVIEMFKEGLEAWEHCRPAILDQ
ncbi:hypothetical protein NPIL_118511, partial [Nephila pilipes]